MKSKLLVNIFFIILITFILSGLYFGIFIFPKVVKIKQILAVESTLSMHRVNLTTIRVSVIGILGLSYKNTDFSDQIDFYLNNLDNLKDKIELKEISTLSTYDKNKLKDLSRKTSSEIANIYTKLKGIDNIYGKIFLYDPVVDLNLDLQANDSNGIVTKTENTISFLEKLKADYSNNYNINSKIDKNLVYLHKINFRANEGLLDDEIGGFILSYDESFSILKGEIFKNYQSILSSDEAVLAIKDLSNLIIMEENYLSDLKTQKEGLLRLLGR
ncbi:hypothetical protein A2V49_03365 [candidate division WWE3 bacterium RBG_19FT_COMBO_34_6]|uniref:Uncharacterized protein n=1 Tax=candidate division WWE3 bacterium RBG_19FT_COMBO_34_6 TaxID=1802612 RepID=A0A1F4UKK8_UNCKA|nr:MAG: hypothetical protein A2V49_03365 [candidate division WWE3 bacterium RBG_19FT_COMBO_34_6]